MLIIYLVCVSSEASRRMTFQSTRWPRECLTELCCIAAHSGCRPFFCAMSFYSDSISGQRGTWLSLFARSTWPPWSHTSLFSKIRIMFFKSKKNNLIKLELIYFSTPVENDLSMINRFFDVFVEARGVISSIQNCGYLGLYGASTWEQNISWG